MARARRSARSAPPGSRPEPRGRRRPAPSRGREGSAPRRRPGTCRHAGSRGRRRRVRVRGTGARMSCPRRGPVRPDRRGRLPVARGWSPRTGPRTTAGTLERLQPERIPLFLARYRKRRLRLLVECGEVHPSSLRTSPRPIPRYRAQGLRSRQRRTFLETVNRTTSSATRCYMAEPAWRHDTDIEVVEAALSLPGLDQMPP